MASAPSPSPQGQFARALVMLARHKVDFVLCGGVACVMHGVSRVTGDVDLLLDMSEANLKRLLRATEEMGMRPRIPEPAERLLDSRRRQEWVRDKAAVVYTFVHPDNPIQLDIFLTYPLTYDDVRSRASIRPINGESIFVSSAEDLIRAKRAVRPIRPIDQRDIEDLERLISAHE
jgi:hypothetical protein